MENMFSFDVMPMPPIVMEVMIHIKPSHQQSLPLDPYNQWPE
jgi:hypothetical protein